MKTGKCTDSVVAQQDHCSYKTPTKNHHIKEKDSLSVSCFDGERRSSLFESRDWLGVLQEVFRRCWKSRPW